MAGLRKDDPTERKSYHLRVPLSPRQRALIEDAARLDEQDKAGWARAILLAAAKRTISKNKRES
jgi:uncharacterized protein (DUF1778 family)